MAQSILYYPTINIEDSAWLRSAILYWDEINSIVPCEDYCKFSNELLFLQSTGQYRPIYPEEIFVLGNSHEFSLAVKRIFQHDITNVHIRKKEPLTERIYSPDLVSLVHYKKIPDETLDLLTRHKLISFKKDGWVVMSKDFAMKYMRLLAEFAATNNSVDTVIGTSQVSRMSEIYPQEFNTHSSHVISISLEECLPIPTMDVGIEDLICFKEHHQDDLYDLRCKIRNFEQSIAKSEDYNQLKATVEAFRESWEKELDSAEKMFRGMHIKFILGNLRSFVTDAGALAGLAQWTQDNVAANIPKAAIGAAIGMTGLVGIGSYSLRYKNQVSAMKKGNGFAYVISAKREGLLK